MNQIQSKKIDLFITQINQLRNRKFLPPFKKEELFSGVTQLQLFDESVMPFVSIMLVGCMVAFGAVVFKYYKRRNKKVEPPKDPSLDTKKND